MKLLTDQREGRWQRMSMVFGYRDGRMATMMLIDFVPIEPIRHMVMSTHTLPCFRAVMSDLLQKRSAHGC